MSPARLPAARLLVLALLALLPTAGGCQKKEKKPAPPPTPATPDKDAKELSVNPAVLWDAQTEPGQMTLYGVKLNDPQADLPPADVTQPADENGWVGFKGKSNVFRVEDGKVKALRLADDAALAKLDLHTEQEVLQKFGKDPAGAIDPASTDPAVPYYFPDRRLTVTWDRKSSRVASVQIGP